MIATRMSTSLRPALSRAAPSCGRRRSAMLRLALRQHAGRRRHHAQQAVDTKAHDEPRGKRLDVDVAGAQFHRLFQQIVDRAHDRRAACEIAQALDIVLTRLGRKARRQIGIVLVQPMAEDDGEVLRCRDPDLNAWAKHDLRRALRRLISRIGHCEHNAAVRASIWKDNRFAKETLRERRHERRRRHHVLQRDALKIMETRGFIRELAGRQIGQFPQLGLTDVRPAPRGWVTAPVNRRQALASAEIFHELRGQIGGHSSVRSPSLSRRSLFKTESWQKKSAGELGDAAGRQPQLPATGRLLIRSMTPVRSKARSRRPKRFNHRCSPANFADHVSPNQRGGNDWFAIMQTI
jgi:hypothetical protein